MNTSVHTFACVLFALIVMSPVNGVYAQPTSQTSRANLQNTQPPPPVSVEGANLQAGDIVAQGVSRLDGGCEFGRIEITTVAPAGGVTQWLAIALEPSSCQAVVVAKWAGILEDGPAIVTSPLIPHMAEIKATPIQLFSSKLAGPSTGVGIFATPGSKISEQQIYSYGGGGQDSDRLTWQTGGINFYWDPYNNAFLSSRWGGCGAETWTQNLGWEWRTDSCQETSVQTQGWEVWHELTGSYHCEDLPGGANPCGGTTGYYHSLIDMEKGRGDGSSVCTFGKTGTVVFGPGEQILQGCS